MTLAAVNRKCRGKFAVVMPRLRDGAANRPRTFEVLKQYYHAQDSVKAYEYYMAEGFEGVFILPCFVEDSEVTDLEPEYIARMFRVLYGRE